MSIAESFDDLDLALMGEEPDYDAEPSDPGDVEGVNWTLRRLRRLRRQRDADVAVAEAEIDRVRQWLDGRLAVLDNRIGWNERGLEMYHRARLHDDPDAKTISLPYGTLRAKGGASRYGWEYDDEKLIAWARKSCPAMVSETTTYSVPKVELKKQLKVPAIEEGESAPAIFGDDEVVDGVIVTDRGYQFSVDLS